MKRTAIILSFLAIAGLSVSCKNASTASETEAKADNTIAAGSIVFFNLDRVINEYDMANDLRSVVQTKAESISQDINRRQSKLERDIKAFQDKINKGLLVSSVAQQQQEIAEEQSVMMNQIADAIKTFVDKYNEEKGYALILTTQGDILPAPVVTGDAGLDITEDILAGLNAEYIKTKNEK